MATMRKYYAAFTPQKTPKPTTLNPIFCDLNFLLLLKHFKGFIFSSGFFEFLRFNITDMFYITSRTIDVCSYFKVCGVVSRNILIMSNTA